MQSLDYKLKTSTPDYVTAQADYKLIGSGYPGSGIDQKCYYFHRLTVCNANMEAGAG